VIQPVARTQLTADLRRLRYADLRRSAKRSQRKSAVNSFLVIKEANRTNTDFRLSCNLIATDHRSGFPHLSLVRFVHQIEWT